jgi:hypothetical protein
VTRIERFLDDLEARWAPSLPERMTFRLVGSTALFLQTAYDRPTPVRLPDWITD